jgi:hypothetical protein
MEHNALTHHPKAEQHIGALLSPTKLMTSTWCVAALFGISTMLSGCGANPLTVDQFKNTQTNLKVAEIPATATTGQNYQYCYGCIEFNYQQFGTFQSMPGVQMLSAITHQVNTCSSASNNFQTTVEVMP